MDPLNATASIISLLQLSSKVLGLLSAVKNASKDSEKCATESVNLYGLLTQLRFRLEEGTSDKPWYTAIRALGIENGPLDQTKQALEELQTKLLSRGRLRKAGEALQWKFRKEEIDSILSRMERLKSLVEVALQMDHFKLSQEIHKWTETTHSHFETLKDSTGLLRKSIPSIESGIDSLRRGQDVAAHKKLMAWLSPLDFPAQQFDNISHREKGTGQWFLDSPELAKWLSLPKETLFCPGIPGAGKTMIASIAIDRLLATEQSSNTGVAYLYCSYKAHDEQNTASLLAALLKQLVQTRPSLMERIELFHQQHTRKGTRPTVEDIFNVLQSVVLEFYTVYVVIDALDECQLRDGTRFRLLTKLRALQSTTDLRLMVTSRRITNIMDEFKEALTLEVWACDEDVKRFVSGQMYRLPECVQNDTELQDMIRENIVEAVDGMFLLARLHMDSLQTKRTPKRIKTALASLSKGFTALDDAYEEALQRIEGQPRDDLDLAKRVLSWITYAQRPLTTSEICCALAVELDEEELDPENTLPIKDIVSVCAGLVVVDEESDRVRLVHYTTQKYFESAGKKWIPSAQVDIASTCLTYLSFRVFKNGPCDGLVQLEQRIKQNAFLDYAANHWAQHTLPVQGEVSELAYAFLRHAGSVSSAAQVVELYFRNRPCANTTGLHFIARFGLSELLEGYLSTLDNNNLALINAEDEDGRTPLLLAVKRGDEQMVKFLVEKGADVNAQNGIALTIASEIGSTDLVKMLLDLGADVNAQSEALGTALYAASKYGHEQIAELLIDAGAEVNREDLLRGNPLLVIAAEKGHLRLVKLLIEHGAIVNPQTGQSALHAASASGHEQVAKLLIDRGADVNAQRGGYYGKGSALHVAAYRGHDHIVKLLLDTGADITSMDADGKGALHYAVDNRDCSTPFIEWLCTHGAPINAADAYGRTPLHFSVKRGHEGITKLLLRHGAGANTVNGKGRSPLHFSIKRGYKDITKLLLSHGAPADIADGKGKTLLHFSVKRGDIDITELLLKHGAPPNVADTKGRTPLHLSIQKGRDDVTKVLLDHGARYRGSVLTKVGVENGEKEAQMLVIKGVPASRQVIEDACI